MSDLIPIYINWQSEGHGDESSAAWVGNYRLTTGLSNKTGWGWHVDLIWPDNHITLVEEGRNCITPEDAKNSAKHAFVKALHTDPELMDHIDFHRNRPTKGRRL